MRHPRACRDSQGETDNMRPQRSPVSFPQVVLLCVSLAFSAHASPLTQITFQNPGLKNGPAHEGPDRLPCLDVAFQSLRDASSQVLETFESVTSEFHDAVRDMTWTLPKKNVVPRSDNWDFNVSSSALPDHSLRGKRPDGLGVDDVKQVYAQSCPLSYWKYAGYLDVNEGKHFFYWFFESRNDPKNDPIVLWLNGGS